MRRISTHESAEKGKVLFLGFDESQTSIIKSVVSDGYQVWHTDQLIRSTADFEILISFGLKHILKNETLQNAECPIINLHISYLPFNRGTHPNFWSFYEGTPSGVTIHLIDHGIDTGDILYQKLVDFPDDEVTFFQTYGRLIREIEKLFEENKSKILSKDFTPTPQGQGGSFHKYADLPNEFLGWHANIKEEIVRLKSLKK